MLKKILIYIGYFSLTAALVVYFYLSGSLSSKASKETVCNNINVRILDSATNRFVSKREIKELLQKEGINVGESKIKHINQYELEEVINNGTAVKTSQVSVTGRGVLTVDIVQRKPIIRIETVNGGFYMDNSAYIFPLMKNFTSYVPVITGEIPLTIPPGYRGEAKSDNEWDSKIYKLAKYIENNPFWDSMIEQIYVDKKGTFYLTARVGNTEIIFGDIENLDYKFRKLNAFYNKVIPAVGWDSYISVDVSFGSQLVCKKRS
ncbi:MAG: hypothetical protein PHR40_03635 [Bacteroidales bacterium]|nr:hypothetical protein [Bacteroidales bacterium]